jgi:hypothetical protein
MASLVSFNKELSRFTLQYKAELLEEFKAVVKQAMEPSDECDDKTCDDKPCLETCISTYIDKSLATIQADIVSLDKKTKGGKRNADKKKGPPRPLSAYNKFIKKVLPEIAKENPTMDNKTRMSKASEKWKTLTDEEKQAYKLMEV